MRKNGAHFFASRSWEVGLNKEEVGLNKEMRGQQRYGCNRGLPFEFLICIG